MVATATGTRFVRGGCGPGDQIALPRHPRFMRTERHHDAGPQTPTRRNRFDLPASPAQAPAG